VKERTDGRMIIKHNGKALKFKGIMERPTKEEKPLKPLIIKPRRKFIPPEDLYPESQK
jgi:hypothetical protein